MSSANGAGSRPIPRFYGLSPANFVIGGLGSALPLVVMNPVEVVKIRLQIQGEMLATSQPKYRGLLHALWLIYHEEGVRGLYKGLSPAMLREGVYASIRMGCYEPLKLMLGEKEGEQLPFYSKMLAGGSAGAVGAFIASPTDVVKIQMQAEGPGVVPKYRSTMHAFATLWKTDGIRGLYRGCVPTSQRAAIISACMIPTYDHTKHYLQDHRWLRPESIEVQVVSGMTAGVAMGVVSSPIDVIKTRIMNQTRVGGLKYRGSLDCLYKTVKIEGPLALYKGLVPNVMRLGPHTLMAFLIVEKLRNLAGLRGI